VAQLCIIIIKRMKAMKNTKALIAVALFVATLLFTAFTNEARPETGKSFGTKKVISPVKQDSTYIFRITSL